MQHTSSLYHLSNMQDTFTCISCALMLKKKLAKKKKKKKMSEKNEKKKKFGQKKIWVKKKNLG